MTEENTLRARLAKSSGFERVTRLEGTVLALGLAWLVGLVGSEIGPAMRSVILRFNPAVGMGDSEYSAFKELVNVLVFVVPGWVTVGIRDVKCHAWSVP